MVVSCWVLLLVVVVLPLRAAGAAISAAPQSQAQAQAQTQTTFKDTRNIRNGVAMLTTGYTDQPYCAVNPKSAVSGGEVWTCVITASFGGEGSAGEQVYSVFSDDQGATWSKPLGVENGTTHVGGVPNAYANIVYAPELNRLYVCMWCVLVGVSACLCTAFTIRHGVAWIVATRTTDPYTSFIVVVRLFVCLVVGWLADTRYTVYNLNLDNITMKSRVDELGYFYMRYSDDDGRSWSADRHLVPYPNTWIDRQNDFHGEHHIMWTVDHFKIMDDGAAAFAFTKIGKHVFVVPPIISIRPSPTWFVAAPPPVLALLCCCVDVFWIDG